jgi:hypothetical protein
MSQEKIDNLASDSGKRTNSRASRFVYSRTTDVSQQSQRNIPHLCAHQNYINFIINALKTTKLSDASFGMHIRNKNYKPVCSQELVCTGASFFGSKASDGQCVERSDTNRPAKSHNIKIKNLPRFL